MAVDTQDPAVRDWAVPAGEVLAEALVERGWTQAELARRTDRPLKTINEIVKGKTVITPETALQLELVLGIPAHIWLNLERAYGESLARNRERDRLNESSKWIGRFPVADLAKHRLIRGSGSRAERLEALFRFFAVANESAWQRQWSAVPVALRRSQAFEPKTESLAAWLRWGEIEAEKIECKPFDIDSLTNALQELRTFTLLDPFAFEVRLRSTLANSGIAFVLVPELSGTRISGAARWLTTDKALVQLSLRHKRDDQFWFTLFHELGHLLRGSRRTTYVDVHIEGDPGSETDEIAADAFASECLVPSLLFDEFVRARVFDAKHIEQFATAVQVSPGIVVGRLQHDNIIPPSRLNYLKRTIEFAS
jgi:HTH-type transcriptional regulator / antitoxin HigA